MKSFFPAVFLGLGLLGCGSDATVAGGSSVDAGDQNQPNGNGGSTSEDGGTSSGNGGGNGTDGGLIADASFETDSSAGPSVDGSTAGGGEGGTGCGAGQICFMLDGESIVGTGGGYTIDDASLGEYAFVKYELGLVQLSIDIFAMQVGDYDASEVRAQGNARVYYFDENSTQFMSSSGTVTVTALANGTISGTFSATVEEFENEAFTGGSQLEVTDGIFVGIAIPTP